VLEHVKQPERALAVLTRLCAPGGHVLVTVPDGAVDDWSGHESFWTEAEFERLLQPFGTVDVQRVDGGGVLLGHVTPA
jgi:hypothetical protein